MEDYKFKVGDRVRVIKIDDDDYYCAASYKVGDIGTIEYCFSNIQYGNYYCIRFDQLTNQNQLDYWAALESWLVLVNQNMLITCE